MILQYIAHTHTFDDTTTKFAWVPAGPYRLVSSSVKLDGKWITQSWTLPASWSWCHCHAIVPWSLGMSWQLKLFWGSIWNSHDLRMSAIAGWISMFFCSCSKLCSWTWNGRLNKNLFRPGIVEYSSLEIALGVNHVVFGCVWMCLKVLPLLVSTWICSLMMEFPWFDGWVDLTECLQMVVWDLNRHCWDDLRDDPIFWPKVNR